MALVVNAGAIRGVNRLDRRGEPTTVESKGLVCAWRVAGHDCLNLALMVLEQNLHRFLAFARASGPLCMTSLFFVMIPIHPPQTYRKSKRKAGLSVIDTSATIKIARAQRRVPKRVTVAASPVSALMTGLGRLLAMCFLRFPKHSGGSKSRRLQTVCGTRTRNQGACRCCSILCSDLFAKPLSHSLVKKLMAV